MGRHRPLLLPPTMFGGGEGGPSAASHLLPIKDTKAVNAFNHAAPSDYTGKQIGALAAWRAR